MPEFLFRVNQSDFMNDRILTMNIQQQSIAQSPSSLQITPTTQSAKTKAAPTSIAPATAKRLASTKGMSREQWLSVRKQGIGSSDAAAACGLNPHMSMLELWMIKTGRTQNQSGEPGQHRYSPLYWGKQLEPLIADYYRHKTGHKVRRVNAVLQHPEPECSFMLANLDYAVVGSDEVQLLECKSVGEWGTRHWRHAVPLYVLIQVQHQLAVTGKQAAHLCALICGHEARIFKVSRNEQVIAQIIQAERQFWEYVKQDVPPGADASESSAQAIQQLYPEHQPLQSIDFSEREDMNRIFDALLTESYQLAEHQQQYDLFKHQIQMQMQQAEKAVFKSGTIIWKKSKDSILLNHKELLKDQPELLAQYPQTRAGSRRFMVHPAD